jgi:hypothetical protein
LSIRDRGHLDEVLETDAIPCQQRQMKGRVAASLAVAVAALAGRNVGFVTDDRIETGRFAFLVQLNRAEQIAVIGQGERVHAEVFRLRHQLGYATGAVEETVMTVTVEMNERPIRHGKPSPL